MKTARACLGGAPFLAVLAVDSLADENEPFHHRIEAGESFDFTVEVKSYVANLKASTREERYTGFAHNRAGDLILEVEKGRPKKFRRHHRINKSPGLRA